ncbi:hypothetical protein BH09MYX1_BH09MYX1_35120 [soil metagenome]
MRHPHPAPPAAPPSVQIGSILAGKYRIEEKLGEGGMGVVYGGLHLELKTRVAIKFLLPDAMTDARAKARFLREARLAASIEGEHSTRIQDVTIDESGRAFIVMERLSGESADARLIREGRLGLADAATIIVQMLDAVAEAHARGLVHRDLKPANLFLTERPGESIWVKVLDFGISKLTEETKDEESITLTAPRTLLGSPEYMSPEQLRDSASVDLRSDLWACGVTLYELLSGQTPFRGDNLADLCALVLAASPPPLSTVGVERVPPDVERIIRKCLEKERSNRPRNAYEVASALAPFAHESALALLPRIRAWCKETALPLSASSLGDHAPRRHVFLGGIALIAVAGAAAFVAASIRYAPIARVTAARPDPSPAVSIEPTGSLPMRAPAATASAIPTTISAIPTTSASSAEPKAPKLTGRTAPKPKPKDHDLDGIGLIP